MASFSRHEMKCKFHKQDDMNVCFCAITHETCNKMNCPQMRKQVIKPEESREDRAERSFRQDRRAFSH